MMNHNSTLNGFALCAVAAVGLCAMVSGCGEEKAAPVAVNTAPPPPPAPPPAPRVTPVAQLMEELNIDKRITLAEDQAPDNNADRKAILVFFDAMARGNAQSLKGMLPLTDQMELDALVDSGSWKATVDQIQQMQLQTGTNSLNQKCALAVIEVGNGMNMTFQPQLWYYTTEKESPLFEAAPTPPGIMDKLSGNWIGSWHQILADELAMADKPDEDLILAQKNVSSENDSTAPPPEAGPTSSDGPGLRNRPINRPKRQAPGPGQ